MTTCRYNNFGLQDMCFFSFLNASDYILFNHMAEVVIVSTMVREFYIDGFPQLLK